MNIIDIPFIVEAKTMGNLKTKNVSYYFSESTHRFCLVKNYSTGPSKHLRETFEYIQRSKRRCDY
jgi:hypothetical protein